MFELYNLFCKKCNTKTSHLIALQSRKRGCKLRCLRCSALQSRYTKFDNLEKLKVESNND